MKSLEVWRRGYKADFSPWRWRSKCKVSPLPCLPWDSVGGVGQGQFCILHKSGIDSPVLWRSPGLSSVRVCWDCWQYGRSAWALALSGVQAGRRSFTVIFWPFLSFPSSLLSLCPLPSISWAALALLSGWLGDCIGCLRGFLHGTAQTHAHAPFGRRRRGLGDGPGRRNPLPHQPARRHRSGMEPRHDGVVLLHRRRRNGRGILVLFEEPRLHLGPDHGASRQLRTPHGRGAGRPAARPRTQRGGARRDRASCGHGRAAHARKEDVSEGLLSPTSSHPLRRPPDLCTPTAFRHPSQRTFPDDHSQTTIKNKRFPSQSRLSLLP